MKKYRILLPLLATSLAVAGCARPPEAPSPDIRAVFVRAQAEQARSREYRGDLNGALQQWHRIGAVEPDNIEVQGKVRQLEVQIESRSKSYYEQGRRRLEEGAATEAERLLLMALALNPRDRKPLELLQEIEERRMRESQVHALKRYGRRRVDSAALLAKKSGVGPSYEDDAEPWALQRVAELIERGELAASVAALDEYAAARPDDERVRPYLSDALRQLGSEYHRKGELALALESLGRARRLSNNYDPRLDAEILAVRKRYAEQLYTEGVRVLGADTEQAIRYWEQALLYDGEHGRAKLRLEEAYADGGVKESR